MKFTLYTSTEEKYASCPKRVLFEDGTDHAIQLDNDGREFFYVPNPYWTDTKTKVGRLTFTDRIKDAIMAIREGYAHALNVKTPSLPFLGGECPVWFIDEEYGETLRQQTIEGFKDTVFSHRIMFGFSNSFSGPRPLYRYDDNNHYDTTSPTIWPQSEYATFETVEEAKKVIETLEKLADEQLPEYQRICLLDQKEETKKEADAEFEAATKNGFFRGVLGYMVDYRYHKGTEHESEHKYYIRVAQCIVPPKPTIEEMIR